MAVGDEFSQKQKNDEIGTCAGHIHVALHSYADEHGFAYSDRIQVLVAIVQNLFGDELSDKKKNDDIGMCAGHVHVALHSYADEHKLVKIDKFQALLAVLQNLSSMMRENPDVI